MICCNPTTIKYNRNHGTFKYIRSTCYYLCAFSVLIDLYLAYNKLVCIRMSFYFKNLTYNNLFKILIKFLITFNFDSYALR